jgi:hypothetical protein
MKVVTFKILTTEEGYAKEIFEEMKEALLKYVKNGTHYTMPYIIVEESITNGNVM